MWTKAVSLSKDYLRVQKYPDTCELGFELRSHWIIQGQTKLLGSQPSLPILEEKRVNGKGLSFFTPVQSNGKLVVNVSIFS